MASVDRRIARRVLAQTQTFRGKAFQIRSIYGNRNEEKCFRVRSTSDTLAYKVRFSTATSQRSTAQEYEALSLLSRSQVDWAPRLYEVNLNEPSYLLTQFVEGETLDKSLSWMSHAKSIRCSLSRKITDIHRIRGDYFGYLTGPRYESWQRFFEVKLWRHVMPLVKALLVSERDLDRIKALYDEAGKGLSEVAPILLHGDVKPANVVFDLRTNQTTLIDFELARFGDKDFEWTKMRRMAIRWPQYQEMISQPLLNSLSRINLVGYSDAKLLLYDIYHAFSFADFELETGIPVAGYRLADIAELLATLKRRMA